MLILKLSCFLTLPILIECYVKLVKITNGTQVRFQEHTNAFLTCVIRGDPEQYQWIKRGENNSITIIPNSNKTRLDFINADRNDSGIYVCQATSIYDSGWISSKDCHVSVVPKGLVVNVQLLNETRINIFHKTDAIVMCRARGRHVKYQWSKRGFWGTEDVITEGKILKIHNFTKLQTGVYICQARAQNQSYWVNSTEVELVWKSDKTTYVEITNGSYVSVRKGIPSITLSCEADGYLIEYEWCKIDFWGTEQILSSSNQSDLVITKLNHIHEDRYVCLARSKLQSNWVKSKPTYVRIITEHALVRIVNGSIVLIPQGNNNSFLLCDTEEDAEEFRWIKYAWHNPAVRVSNCTEDYCEFPEFTQKYAGKYACQVKIISDNREVWLTSAYTEVRVLYMASSAPDNNQIYLKILFGFFLINIMLCDLCNC